MFEEEKIEAKKAASRLTENQAHILDWFMALERKEPGYYWTSPPILGRYYNYLSSKKIAKQLVKKKLIEEKLNISTDEPLYRITLLGRLAAHYDDVWCSSGECDARIDLGNEKA